MPAKRAAGDAPLILLVDDIDDNLEVYSQFFAHCGWRSATASNGEEGLKRASELAPDVIVLDLGMPVMDGWEVARRLRANPVTQATPLIALTGHVLQDARQRAKDAGVDEYLTKPCLPLDLVEAVKRHLPRTRK